MGESREMSPVDLVSVRKAFPEPLLVSAHFIESQTESTLLKSPRDDCSHTAKHAFVLTEPDL